MIVDAHTHLGHDAVFERDFTREELARGIRAAGVDVALVQPGALLDLGQLRAAHDEIAALADAWPGRVYGIANVDPHMPGEIYVNEVERCARMLGFVGIKLHPLAHAVDPDSPDGRRAFDAGRKFGMPVMVHTGSGFPWSLPSRLLPLAEAYPDVTVVLAHAGMTVFADEAVLVAERCRNVVLETSWSPGYLIRRFVAKLGADRVMFGSDHGDQAETEVEKIRACGLSEAELDWVLGRTAATVFALHERRGEHAHGTA